MRQLLITRTLQLIGGITLWCWIPITVAKAQIASDGTLSTNVNTSDGLNFTIDNGSRAGNNLFHSFREFSVPTGGSAFFNNALDVQNIFSRVTGGNISNIDGWIKANGTANLFLINPSGIIFGPNARLNIGGSFLASTADSLLFDGGIEFSATNSSAAPLLAINIPVGLQFRDRAAGISVQTSTLEVQPGRTLALVGGDVLLSGATLNVAGGQVELGGLAGTGIVGLNFDSNLLSLNFPEGVLRTDVSITNKSSIDVRAGNGGSITVNAGNLEILGESKLQAGIKSGLGTVDAKAGDINFNAIGAISIGQSSSVRNVVSSNGIGQGGDIIITAGSLSLSDNGLIANGTGGQGNAGDNLILIQNKLELVNSKIQNFVGSDIIEGNAGNIELKVGSIFLNNQSEIANFVGTSRTVTGKRNNAGDIKIDTFGDISLLNGSRLSTTTFGQGDAGSITIRAGGIVLLDGILEKTATEVRSNVAGAGSGKVGNIDIQATSLFLKNGAQLNASNSTFGDGGSIFIQMSDLVSLTGSNTAILSKAQYRGNGGDINIIARSVSLSDGSRLDVSNAGRGNSGNIVVKAVESVSLSNSNIRNLVESTAVGNGGEINITTGSLSLTNSSEITSTLLGKGTAGNILVDTSGSVSVSGGSLLRNDTSGQGNGGKITIQSGGLVSFDGVGVNGTPSGAITTVASEAVGNGGEINIKAGSLSLSNNAQIRANIFGTGDAGNVSINVRDRVSIENSFVLTNVEAEAIGKGGNISIQSGSLSLSDGAELVTSTLGQGDAGSVKIKASGTVSFDGVSKSGLTTGVFSTVEAGAKGKGGDIRIESGGLSLTNGATLSTATYGQGNSGYIEIQAQQLLLNNGSQMLTATSGQGDAGNILVQTDDLISLIGNSTGISSSINPGGIGNGGNINIKTNITTGSLLVSNEAVINASTYGEGNGGSINVTTGSLSLTDKAQLFTSTFGQGNAGNVIVDAENTATFSGLNTAIGSTVESGAVGKGGNITLTARSLSVTNGAALTASTRGTGNAGDVTIQVNDAIFLDGTGGDQFTNPSGASSTVNSGAIGNGGNVTVTTGSLSMTNGAVLLATTFGNGNAGNVNVKANHEVSLDRSFINSTVVFGAVGNGGNITIAANSISLLNGAEIGVSTFGNGNSGSVFLQAEDAISLSGDTAISSTVEAGAIGNSSGIEMKAGSIFITSGAQLRSSTDGKGNAGNVNIIARDTFSIDGVGITGESSGILSTVKTGGEGNGGNIEIKTGSLSLSDGALFSTSTFGQGNAGSVFVQAEGLVLLSGNSTAIFTTVEAGAVGKGGEINITAGSLSLTNGAQLQTLVNETSGTIPGGRGNAGDVRIEARDTVTVAGINNGVISAIISAIGPGAVGDGGNIGITARSLSLADGAQLNTTTFGQGNAGNVFVQTSESVSLSNSSIFSQVQAGAVGDGGDIIIQSSSLSLTNGAGLFSNTFGQGNAGDIKLENRRLILRDGAVVAASTNSGGKGGTLTVIASESVELSGTSADGQLSSGLTTESQADGSAGDLTISTGRLIVRDGAGVAVDGKGKGATGNLKVTADSIRLNGGILTAESVAGDRGNISLQSQDVQLRRTSSITTNAQGNATGGNITINTGILAALENSDIRANAKQGSGGQVRINAQGIFGSVSRTREDLQTLLNTNDPNLLDPSLLPTSDITAISQQGGPQSQGSVLLITPDVDPSSGLIELPQTIVDPDALIAQNPCTLGKGSEFTVTGRGGLPSNPSEALSSTSVRVSLVEPTQPSTTGSNTAMTVRSPRPDSLPIVPAQGWILNEKGQLVFTAYDPTGTGSNRLGRNPPICPAR